MRIKKIRFRFGASEGDNGLVIDPSQVMLIVGPNNSGKTLTLGEIENELRGATGDFKVIESIEMHYPDEFDSFIQLVNLLHPRVTERGYSVMNIGDFMRNREAGEGGVEKDRLRADYNTWLASSGRDEPNYIRLNYVTHFTLRLDAPTRFSLVEPHKRGPQSRVRSHLDRLFKDDKLRERVRKICLTAFPSRYLVLDPTSGDNLRVMMSAIEPQLESERSLTDAAYEFFG